MPEALWFTEDEAANRLLADDPFALLVGFALDQQVTVQQAFLGPLRLKQRLGTLDPPQGREGRPRAALPREARDPPLPRLDGRARARARRDRRRGLRRRRVPHLDGGRRRHRPPQAHRRTPRLRRDEDQVARRRAREALRRRGRAGARPGPSDARRRRLGAGADRLPGREEGAQGRVAWRRSPHADRRRPAGRARPPTRSPTFFAAAKQTLEIAIYDFNLPPDLDEIVCGALDAARRSAASRVRLAYNLDHAKDVPVPPPPITDPDALEAMPFPTAAIPGVPDLMHHKYVVRDGASVWTGSTNWTADSWTREENVIVTVDSPALAARYLEDFEQLWTTRNVARSGKVDTAPVDGHARLVLPGPRREARAPDREGDRRRAQRRVRIASPVISSAPILATLAQVASDGKVDLAGVVDATQVAEVLAAVARERERRLEGAAAANGAHPRAVLGQGHDAVRARLGARLHAREGDRRRRHRLRRQLQPLALGRAERRERARAPGPADRRPSRRFHRRGARPAIRLVQCDLPSPGSPLYGGFRLIRSSYLGTTSNS